MDNESYMRLAIIEAKKASRQGLLPVASIVFSKKGEQVSVGLSTVGKDNDPTAHNDMNAIREASKKLGLNFVDCLLVTTIEPCSMCLTAAYWAGINTVLFGASQQEVHKNPYGLNGYRAIEMGLTFTPRVNVSGGVLAVECAGLLSNYKNWMPE